MTLAGRVASEAPPVILFYHDRPGMYGTKRYSLDLLEALRAEGVAVRARRAWTREVTVAGRRFGGLVSKQLSLAAPVLGRGLVHATYHSFMPRLRRSHVVTVHDMIPVLRPDLAAGGPKRGAADLRHLEHAVRTGAEIVAVSAATKADVLRVSQADAERVHVVHHGVHHGRFFPESRPDQPPAPFRPGFLNVLAAMNTDLRKRLDLLVDAALALPFVNLVQVGHRATTPDVAARMAGLRDREAVLERQGRYTVLAHVDDDRLRHLLSNADVVAHPSAAEGFSLPPLEALACGAAVAVSDIPVHREILGGAARFVPLTVEDWSRLLQDAWDGERLRTAAFPARAGRLAHAQTFTWQAAARRTADVYRRVAGP